MVLGKLPVPGLLTIWMIVGQGPTALAVGGGGGCLDIFTLFFFYIFLDIFTLFYLFSPLSPSLWERARYRLKYCLKGPLNPKQPINQPYTNDFSNALSRLHRNGNCSKSGCHIFQASVFQIF